MAEVAEGAVVDGRYRIGRRIGSGGMADVYIAQDSQLGRRVALKFLPPEMAQDQQLLERFQREARSASSLNHPNICTIHAIEQHELRHFIVMELLEGGTLAQKMTRQPMEIDKLLALAIQIADALESAHSKGIVHRVGGFMVLRLRYVLCRWIRSTKKRPRGKPSTNHTLCSCDAGVT